MPNNPILLQWDASVMANRAVCTAVQQGIDTIGRILPRATHLINNRPLVAGQGLSVDDHLDSAIYAAGRVEHDRLQSSRAGDGWRAEARFDYTDLLITGRDLVVGSMSSVLPYVLGFAGDGVAMVSVHRMLRHASMPHRGLKVIELVVAHELGHTYGIVPDGARRQDPRGGIYHRHCTNPGCAMRQFGTVPEAEALLTTTGGHVIFCTECTRDLTSLRGQTFAAGRKTYGVTFRR